MSSDIEPRLSHIERRMTGVEEKLDTVILTLGGIATKSEIRNYAVGTITLMVAIIAVIVTAMGWLETRASRLPTAATPIATAPPQPIVIQVPYPIVSEPASTAKASHKK